MVKVSNEELNRQFRVLKQTLGMHAELSRTYKRRALILDIILLSSSALLCATVFVDDDFLQRFNCNISTHLITGIFSVAVFIGALFSIKVDWKGLSAQHADGVKRLTKVLSIFRRYSSNDNIWPDDCRDDLNDSYWSVYKGIIEIPQEKFLKLKVHYLRAVEISKLSSKFPGCPLCLLKCFLLFYLIQNCCKKKSNIKELTEKGLEDVANNRSGEIS